LADASTFCSSCGADLPRQALSCPGCDHLVHAAALEDLARRASERETARDFAGASRIWRDALLLLPPGSTQSAAVRERITSLEAAVKAAQKSREKEWVKRFGPLGAAAAFALKFKTAGLLLLTKGKFLLLGLAKLPTLLSMLATVGVYWGLYGWKFAAGFVLGIYIHEMGHVWMLHHYGLRASAPMFIPGFGAFVSLYDSPAEPGHDARIGLAGPLWGAGAALAFVVPQLAAPGGVWAAIAYATAYINLFNLTPVWQLDGGRGFRALNQQQRLYILGLMLVLWYLTGQGIFIILLLGAAYRVFWKKDPAPAPDFGLFLQFAALLCLFAAILAWVPAGQR
jgi:Zn-dependent protease